EEIKSLQFPIRTVIYSKKSPAGEECKVKFSENLGIVYQNRDTVGYLDSNVSSLLKKYSSEFNQNFCCEIYKIDETSENFNIFLEIFKDYNFKTYAIKDSQLFTEIKDFIIGNNHYTTKQKTILRAIFKEKINYEAEFQKNSAEIEQLFLTIAIYNFVKKNKVLIVTGEKISEKLRYYSHISDSFKEGFDFYIFLNSNEKERTSEIKYLDISIF
ncbi:MAG: hypothetical protein ACRCZ9_10590, partial [Fusobacteriaceae bacterium]